MYPLQYEIDVKAYSTTGHMGDIIETFPARKVRVFSWALVSGNSAEIKQDGIITLQTTERLQVIAPPGTFRKPASGEVLEVVVIEDQEWTLTDTEEKHEANPWWSPGLSVYWFDRDVSDYVPGLPGDPDEPIDPEDPDSVPEAYKFNPYATSGNALYDQGVGSPYGGQNFPENDDYNPYNDEGGAYGEPSPFHGKGGGPYGTEWPDGQSAEARNAYQESLGNVG